MLAPKCKYMGYSNNLARLYGPEKTPCNIDSEKSSLSKDEGLFYDPLSNGSGFCRRIPKENTSKTHMDFISNRWTNKEIVQKIGELLGKKVKYKFVEDRLGHDRKYALKTSLLDIGKLKTLEEYLKEQV